VRRETRDAWAARVKKWRDSGLSAREFARREGINDGTLQWWSSRLGRDAKGAAATPLTFVEMTGAVRPEPIEVVLTSGLRLRVPQDCDPVALERLLNVLTRAR
jgi:transposase